MARPYEYEEKDKWGKPINPEDRIMDVDQYIARLDDPKEKFTASIAQRLAIIVSLLEAIGNGLEEVIPRLRDGHYGIPEDAMFVTMLGDVNKEVKKTEELMEVWGAMYGQES